MKDAQDLQAAAPAPSTHRVYASGLKCFLHFCAHYGYSSLNQLLPSPLEELFIAFVVYCAKRINISMGTIKVYLAGI